jgi:hypothetical protein
MRGRSREAPAANIGVDLQEEITCDDKVVNNQLMKLVKWLELLIRFCMLKMHFA